MRTVRINSHDELRARLMGASRAFVLIYKDGTEKSTCAMGHILESGSEDVEVLTVDVNQVRDVHPAYGVTSAPTLLVFQDGKMVNMIKGCHDKAYFRSIFDNIVQPAGEGTPTKSVTVYTTPTCSWCNTLKAYLRQKGVRFHEVDISRDPSAAEDLVRTTGQQGVPQTNISGDWVVGFDKARINTLLGIQ